MHEGLRGRKVTVKREAWISILSEANITINDFLLDTLLPLEGTIINPVWKDTTKLEIKIHNYWLYVEYEFLNIAKNTLVRKSKA